MSAALQDAPLVLAPPTHHLRRAMRLALADLTRASDHATEPREQGRLLALARARLELALRGEVGEA